MWTKPAKSLESSWMSLRRVQLNFAPLNGGAQHWRNMTSSAPSLSLSLSLGCRGRLHLEETRYGLEGARGTYRSTGLVRCSPGRNKPGSRARGRVGLVLAEALTGQPVLDVRANETPTKRRAVLRQAPARRVKSLCTHDTPSRWSVKQAKHYPGVLGTLKKPFHC